MRAADLARTGDWGFSSSLSEELRWGGKGWLISSPNQIKPNQTKSKPAGGSRTPSDGGPWYPRPSLKQPDQKQVEVRALCMEVLGILWYMSLVLNMI